MPSRRSTILIGVLLCLGSLGCAAVCGAIYALRNTDFRGVSLAIEHRQDPYQAALEGADRLALDFAVATAGFAFAVFAVGTVMVFAARRRAT